MTKRLLGLSLLAMLLLVGSAFAQNVEIWFGGSWDGTVWVDTIKGRSDNNVNVPVFVMTDPAAYVANVHFPLGVNDIYVDDIPLALCSKEYAPFVGGAGWDDASFLGTFEAAPPNPAGFHSRSFLGFADLGGGPNPWLHFETPTQILNFVVHTLVDPGTWIGNTYSDVLQAGVSSTLGGFSCGDTVGGPGYTSVTHFAYFLFSANSAPEFVLPMPTLPADFCGHAYSEYSFCITDADGNPLDVTSNYGTVVEVSEVVEGGITTWCGYIDFCGVALENVDVIVTATDGSDPVTYTFAGFSTTGLVGSMIAAMDDSFPMWPGYSAWMPVTLDGGCTCIGGFEFTIVYDPTVLQILDVRREAPIAGGEYWYVNYHPAITPGCPPGTPSGAVKVTFINDLNNQLPPADPCIQVDGDAIFSIKWYVNPEYDYPVNFCIPICFYMCEPVNYQWNAVTDETGLNVWKTEGCLDAFASTNFLDLNCGNIKIQTDGNVVPGDVNHNLQPYEIGDAVLLANYLMDPVTYPLDPWQLHAADINGDGVYGSIADLIMLINIINGTIMPGGKLAPMNVAATVAMPANASGNMDVTVTSEASVGGAVVRINHAGVEIGAPIANGLDMVYTDKNGVLSVVVYNGTIAAGTHTLFTVPVVGSGSMTFGDVAVSDNIGHTLNASAKVGQALPTAFSVAQNYPNPFNVKTSISFALPTSANVTVTIYNVAGQVVQTINAGQMDAGVNSVNWDASNVGSGVYFYKVVAGEFSKTMKATLLK